MILILKVRIENEKSCRLKNIQKETRLSTNFILEIYNNEFPMKPLIWAITVMAATQSN